MNLPDNCRDNDPSYPWNQEDELVCPECDSILVVNQNNRYCIDMECSECDYSIYNENEDY